MQTHVSMSHGRKARDFLLGRNFRIGLRKRQNVLKPRWKNAGWVQNEQETHVRKMP